MRVKRTAETVMVGITTKQNTANAIPAVQLSVGHYLPINTQKASDENWNRGLEEVLKKRKINVRSGVYLDAKESIEIKSIINKTVESLKKSGVWNYRVFWNIGGGQKIQQLALWYLYQQRKSEGMTDDMLIYADQGSATLNLIWEKDGIRQKIETLKSDFSIEELLKIYGSFEIKGKPSKQSVIESQKEAWRIIDFLSEASGELNPKVANSLPPFERVKGKLMQIFKELLTEYGQMKPSKNKLPKKFYQKLNRMINGLSNGETMLKGKEIEKIKGMVELIRPNIEKLYINGGFSNVEFSVVHIINQMSRHLDHVDLKKPGELYESALQTILLGYIEEADPNREVFVDYGLNVEMTDPDNPERVIGEHDLLVATSTGTLISFDAKLGIKNIEEKEERKNKVKDWLARKLRMERAGGTSAKWVAVLPEGFINKHPQQVREIYSNLRKECEIFALLKDNRAQSIKIPMPGKNNEITEEIEFKSVRTYIENIVRRSKPHIEYGFQ